MAPILISAAAFQKDAAWPKDRDIGPHPADGRAPHWSAKKGFGTSVEFRPSPTFLSDFTSTRRIATRPLHGRNERFDQEFDADTLFFDAFRAPHGDHAVLLGPPLFNLASAFAGLTVRDGRGGPALATRLRPLDRHAQIWVDVPADTTSLKLSTPLGTVNIEVGENRSGLFAGRRVLLTRSRNNPLPWVLDWIRFNRDVNGADAVLFYDNDSSLYSTAELRRAIAGVEGIARSVVVPWPFKYGPQGLDATRFWDSDFCELGAWEHARWMFLANARSVMTGDVDELTYGPRSAFEVAETSWSGLARYYGRWVVDLDDGSRIADVAARRHRDYTVMLRRQPGRNRFGLPIDARRCSAKWTVVPARCPANTQWRMHSIGGWLAGALSRSDLTFGHFRPINTSWKYQRDDATAFDPALHEKNPAFAAAMAKVDWMR